MYQAFWLANSLNSVNNSHLDLQCTVLQIINRTAYVSFVLLKLITSPVSPDCGGITKSSQKYSLRKGVNLVDSHKGKKAISWVFKIRTLEQPIIIDKKSTECNLLL